MSQYYWNDSIEIIKPFVFKVSTPNGSGTGFQISYSKSKQLVGIATAYHVIAHEHEWEESIKITHYQSQKSVVLKNDARAIFIYPDKDLAIILFNKQDIPISESAPELIPPRKNLKQGTETGWCGFPAVAPNELCFFAGYISCYLKKQTSYLVDGVAINGVSGAPAFFVKPDGNIMICGVVSAYLPNRATGEALPGVCFVSSVEPYQAMLESMKSLEEAEKKAEEQKAQIEKDKSEFPREEKKLRINR